MTGPAIERDATRRAASAITAARDRYARQAEGIGAVGPERSVFPAIRVLEVDPPPPPTEHVDGFLIDRDVNLIAGAGGSGKSLVMLHLAACVAIGRPVFGTRRVARPGPVLLVMPEDGHAVARANLDAIVEAIQPTDVERATLAAQLYLIPDDCVVELPKDAAKLGETVAAYGAVLAIFDPIANLLGRAEENEAGLATDVVDSLRRYVSRGPQCTVVVNHHVRKPGKDALNGDASVHDVRGSAGWVNSARTVWGVAKRGPRITLTSWKSNRTRADRRHELDLHIETDPENSARWTHCGLTDADSGAGSEGFTPGVGRDLNANELAALLLLDDRHEPGRRLSYSQWSKAFGNENTFNRVRPRLLDAGLAHAIATGKRARSGSPQFDYALTERGRLFVHKTQERHESF